MDTEKYQNLKKGWDCMSYKISEEKLREIFNNAISKAMEEFADIPRQDYFEQASIDMDDTTDNVEPISTDVTWTEEEIQNLLDVYYHLFDVGYFSRELWERIPHKMYLMSNDEYYQTKTVQQYKDKVDELVDDYDYKRYLEEISEQLDDDQGEYFGYPGGRTSLYYKKHLDKAMEDIDDDNFKKMVGELVDLIDQIPEDYTQCDIDEEDDEDYFNDPHENYCDYCDLKIWDCSC